MDYENVRFEVLISKLLKLPKDKHDDCVDVLSKLEPTPEDMAEQNAPAIRI